MYHPKNYLENSVAYTGTHDNMPIVEWYENLNKKEKNICDENLKNFFKRLWYKYLGAYSMEGNRNTLCFKI